MARSREGTDIYLSGTLRGEPIGLLQRDTRYWSVTHVPG